MSNNNKIALKKFGKYFLLDQVAAGGMAEIYRARLSTPDSSGRIVVVKRILSMASDDEQFLTMFNTETQVSMGLSHPNIIQIHDFGEINNQPFLAMEYVEGRNLKQLLAIDRKIQPILTPELVCALIDQVAAGLNYAHSFKNRITGEVLNIVHRDISPHNILISFDGFVKIIDFGIAKVTRSDKDPTQSRIIKGKLHYLSPEQIDGDAIDGRSDLFSLGVVFYELLTGQKPFYSKGGSDLDVLNQIRAADDHRKRPSKLNPAVPKELDDIVFKLLAAKPSERFASAQELQDAIRAYFAKYNLAPSISEISRKLKEILHRDVETDQTHLRELDQQAIQILSSENTATIGQKTRATGRGRLKNSKNTPFLKSWLFKSVAAAALIAGIAVGVQKFQGNISRFTKSNSPDSSFGYLNVNTTPKAVVEIRRIDKSSATLNDKGSVTNKPYRLQTPILNQKLPSGTYAVVMENKELGMMKSQVVNIQEQKSVDINEKLSPVVAVTLKIKPEWPKDSIVLVNQQEIHADDPIIQIPMDSSVKISIDSPGFQSYSKDFTVDSTQAKGVREMDYTAKLETIRMGYLTITDPPNSDIEISKADATANDVPWLLKTPVSAQRLPIGKYKVKVEQIDSGFKKTMDVTIREARIVTLKPKTAKTRALANEGAKKEKELAPKNWW